MVWARDMVTRKRGRKDYRSQIRGSICEQRISPAIHDGATVIRLRYDVSHDLVPARTGATDWGLVGLWHNAEPVLRIAPDREAGDGERSIRVESATTPSIAATAFGIPRHA